VFSQNRRKEGPNHGAVLVTQFSEEAGFQTREPQFSNGKTRAKRQKKGGKRERL